MLPVERLCQSSSAKDLIQRIEFSDNGSQPRGVLGLPVGLRRIGRLMRDNGIDVRRNRKFKGKNDQATILGIVSQTSGQQPRLQHRTERVESGLPGSLSEPEMGG
jgi:transposase InsO family protein